MWIFNSYWTAPFGYFLNTLNSKWNSLYASIIEPPYPPPLDHISRNVTTIYPAAKGIIISFYVLIHQNKSIIASPSPKCISNIFPPFATFATHPKLNTTLLPEIVTPFWRVPLSPGCHCFKIVSHDMAGRIIFQTYKSARFPCSKSLGNLSTFFLIWNGVCVWWWGRQRMLPNALNVMDQARKRNLDACIKLSFTSHWSCSYSKAVESIREVQKSRRTPSTPFYQHPNHPHGQPQKLSSSKFCILFPFNKHLNAPFSSFLRSYLFLYKLSVSSVNFPIRKG